MRTVECREINTGQSADEGNCTEAKPADSQPCNEQPCPVDCIVSEWNEWGTCSAICGGGTQVRTRTIITPPANGGAECPALSEEQACNTQPCIIPIDCVVSAWSDWDTCSAICGGGTQARTRTIVTPPANGGAECPALSEEQSCNTHACPVYGWVTGDWSECSKECGAGTQMRTVECREINTGQSADEGNCTEAKPADSQPCNEQPCPVDCIVSEWNEWGTCSAICGGGTQARTRTIVTPPANGGAECPALSEEQACNTQPCVIPVDCVVSSWSVWGTCSASCGGGTQVRTRTIITPPANGGAECPALTEEQACNTQACDVLTITINEPSEGAILGASSINVSGTVSDPGARAMVQDIMASVSGTTFDAKGITLKEGPNNITARARNDAWQEAQASRMVILDTTPPAILITSPSERSIFASPSVQIYGTVDDATPVMCFVNGSTASLDGRNLTGTAELQQGANTVIVACQDAAGNQSSRKITLYLDTEPLTVTSISPAFGAVDIDPASSVTVMFSEHVQPSSLNTSSFFIKSGPSIISSGIILSPDGLSAVLTPASVLPSGRIIDIIITTGVRDASGNPMSLPFTSSFTTIGYVAEAGVVIGEVYNDSRSLPLEGATVTAIARETGEPLAQTQTDGMGRYLLNPGVSGFYIYITKPGYTAVERDISIWQTTYAEAIDARLTPLGNPKPVANILGAEISNDSGDRLIIPPGAFNSDADVSLTHISGQGPRIPFPAGWTLLGIVEISAPEAFDPPAELHIADQSGMADGMNAVFVFFNKSSGSWIALSNAVVAEGKAVLNGVTEPGQYALLIPDTGEGAPAAAVAGQPLAEGSSVLIPEDASAVGTVTPPVGRVDDPTPARAKVTITSLTPLRSSTLLRGDFMQYFILRDGQMSAMLDTSQDLFAYRLPSDPEGRKLEAGFLIAPSVVFSLTEAQKGSIKVTMQRSSLLLRSVIGTGGGGVEAPDGSRVIIPAGALSGDVPVKLRRLYGDTFPLAAPAGFSLLGGLELDLSGMTASNPITFTLGDAAWNLTTGASVVVAEARNIKGRDVLVFTALARIEGNDITTISEINGNNMPGVRKGGKYGFFVINAPLEAVTGTARDEDGRREGHIITIDTMPFVSLTNLSGYFANISRPGRFTLTAESAVNYDQAVAEGETGEALPEIVIGPTPPHVESITVRLPKVEGNFAGPVVLLGKPAPIIDDDNAGNSSGNGDDQVNEGERIELTLMIRNDGNVPVENGIVSLVLRDSNGQIDVTPHSISVASLPADAPVTAGPFVFEVPAGADPSELSYTLYFKNGAGLSSETRFRLPMDVDHLNVPVKSEIAVRFSEPVAGLAGGLRLEQDNGTGLVPVETRLLISSDSRTAMLRPLAPLDDNSVFQVTLTSSITDRDGRSLADSPYTERFRTEDLTPPMPVDPGRIEMSAPDAERYVTITGTLGTVNPDDLVFVLNEITGFTVLATVFQDGSFEARLLADVTDDVILIIKDYNGNETRVDPGPFVRRDPVTGEILSVIVGPDGGTVTSDDGISLIVPEGAVPDAAEISLSYNPEPFTLPQDILNNPALAAAFESLFAIIDRININADIRRFSAPVKLSVLPPDGSSAGDLFIIARSRTVTVGGPLADLDRITGLTAAQNPIRTLQRLEIVDSATVKDVNGELVLTSDSPPFPGITEPGDYIILGVKSPLTFLAGEVRRDTVSGPTVKGAVVTSLPGADATSPFAAITDNDGKFVVADANAGGPYSQGMVISSRLDVFDKDYSRVIRRDVRAVVGPPSPPNTVIAHLNEPFVLPARLPDKFIDVLGDIEPPVVKIYFDSPSFVNGFSRAGDPITITVIAEDNDKVSSLGLEVDQGSGFEHVTLAADGTYIMNQSSEALIIFRAEARDPNGNITVTEAVIRIVNAITGIPGPLPGQPPRRIPAPPTSPDGEPTDADPQVTKENEVSFDGDITIRFSEPLNEETVNKDTVTVTDPENKPVEVDIIPADNGTKFRIVPKRYLRLGACYTVNLSAEIQDLEGKSITAEALKLTVPPPVQISTLELENTRDVELIGDTLLVVNRTDTGVPGKGGKLSSYRVRDEQGNLLSTPVMLASRDLMGKPNSLAVDCNLVFIGNSYMGAIATKEPVLIPYFPGITDYNVPDLITGCSPMFPNSIMGAFYSPQFCLGLSQIYSNFPNPPSLLEVFDLTNPEEPDRVGGQVLNYNQDTHVWDPNTSPVRVEKTDHGIAVLNFMDNIEILSSKMRPQSIEVVERVYDYAQFHGRCDGGDNIGKACILDYGYPRTAPIGQCPGGTCASTTEFLDAVFFNGYAVILENDGIRSLYTGKSKMNDPNPDHTIGNPYAIGGTFVGRLGGVPGFKSLGSDIPKNLVFVSGQTDNKLAILDVSDPHSPQQLSQMSGTFGNMSFDACRGLAYVHGRNGEFHVIDFNDPEKPVELNDPGSGKSPFSTEGLGSGVSFNGNTNRNGVVYLSNTPGVAIVQLRTSSRLGKTCDSAETSGTCPTGFDCSWVSPKNSQREECSDCPGADDVEILVDGTDKKKDHILMFTDPPQPDQQPGSNEREHLTLTLKIKDSFTGNGSTSVRLVQQGGGVISFKDADAAGPDIGTGTLEVSLSKGTTKTIKVFGDGISTYKNDVMIQIQVGGSSCHGCSGVRLTVYGIDLDVDSDNNLIIDQNDDDIESLKDDKYPSFLFWVNDYKVYQSVKNPRDLKIAGLKNLENFASLIIDMSTIKYTVDSESDSWLPDGYTFYLEMEKKGESQGSPLIRVYPKFGSGTKYLSDENTAKEQLKLINTKPAGKLLNGDRLYINKEFFDANGKGSFIFEGLSDGEFILKLVLEDPENNVVSEDEVYITLKKLRHMYRAADARVCGNSAWNSEAYPGCVKWPVTQYGYLNDISSVKKSKLVVFVHGYNVPELGTYDESGYYLPGAYDAFDDVFRRLYWSGVTNSAIVENELGETVQKGADFIGLTWYGNEIRSLDLQIGDFYLSRMLQFNRNVFNALYSAKPVAQFLKERGAEYIEGGVNLFVHSLGNVLISNAIKRADETGIGDLNIRKYILHEAAVSSSAYNRFSGFNSNYRIGIAELIAALKGRYNVANKNFGIWSELYKDPSKRKWIDQDPWGDYFKIVPQRVTMINTYSEVDKVVRWAWTLNDLLWRPDFALKENEIDSKMIELIANNYGIPGWILNVFMDFFEEAQWDWDGLPEADELPSGYYGENSKFNEGKPREWDELSYFFQSLSYGAGVGAVEGVKNINSRPLGIDCDPDFHSMDCNLPGDWNAVHSAFLNYPFYDVWNFWNKAIGEELK